MMKTPLSSVYTSAEVTGADADIDKFGAESFNEVHIQITIIDLLKPIFKNLVEHTMSSDMEQVVTVDIVHDA